MPAIRECPATEFGIEGPYVEVLDPILAVYIVKSRALAKGSTQQTAPVAPGTVRTLGEQVGLGFNGEFSKVDKIAPAYSLQRSALSRIHPSMLPR